MFHIDHFVQIFKSFQNTRKDQIKSSNWIYKLNQMKKNIGIQGC